MANSVCNWVRSVLAAYLDGELKAPAARAVERHLEHCESCRAHKRLLEDTWELLGEVPGPPLRSGFTSRMMAQVVEEKELARLEARLGGRRPFREILGAVGGLAAGLLIGFCLYTWTGLLDEPSGPIEQEVSRHLTFLEDLELLDEITLIQEMEHLVDDAGDGQGT